ncbi:MAG: helix-hairpin-helix domain-containing protein [Fibrobacteraceae bacterium]|nr:helix-hairpin-helix domain-containing protein [Fibrobacteraceae bacterium]
MNAPEKKVLVLALMLFALGLLVHFSPWDPVPQMGTFVYTEIPPAVLDANSFAESPKEKIDVHEKKTISAVHKKAKLQVSFPLSINRASAEELCAIKGIGPKLAQKIIAYRTAKGPFSGESDLRKVSGIGKKKSKDLLSFIVFD